MLYAALKRRSSTLVASAWWFASRTAGSFRLRSGGEALHFAVAGAPASVEMTMSGNMVIFLLSQFLLTLVLVEFFQKLVDVFLGQVVRRREAQLVWFGAADADFVGLPHPVFQVHARDGWYVHGDDSAA